MLNKYLTFFFSFRKYKYSKRFRLSDKILLNVFFFVCLFFDQFSALIKWKWYSVGCDKPFHVIINYEYHETFNKAALWSPVAGILPMLFKAFCNFVGPASTEVNYVLEGLRFDLNLSLCIVVGMHFFVVILILLTTCNWQGTFLPFFSILIYLHNTCVVPLSLFY